jgi:hypothetical protein
MNKGFGLSEVGAEKYRQPYEIRFKKGKIQMKMVLASCIAAISLTACATTSQSLVARNFTKLTGSEIRTILPGNSLKGTDKSGQYTIYYTSQRTMKIIRNGRNDTGRWRIDGDMYCRQWTKLGKGKERCVTMFRRGDAIQWVRNDEITDETVLLSGNPAGL